MGNPSELSANQEFEIGDVEAYGNNKDSGFSHQALVMACMRRALENASKEMRAGFLQTKIDRQGNQIKTYVEDTREVFISSVEACLMAMACDIEADPGTDDDKNNKAIPELEKIFNAIDKKKKELLEAEKNEWTQLNPMIKSNLIAMGKGTINGHFNKEKRFYQAFLEYKVEAYREVFKILTRLTHRLDFYQAEVFEA